MNELVRYDAMCRAIAQAHSIDEVKDIRDHALAMEHYARQAKNEELETWTREIRERAEREWAVRYTSGEKAKGVLKQGPNLPVVTLGNHGKLADMGVSKRQSQKWQARAAIPKAEFEATLAAGKSTDPLIKRQRRAEREMELAGRATSAPGIGTLYQVIYADPPWRFEPYSRLTGMDRAADNHYPTMSIDELVDLPVPSAEDCVLFLWATAPMLPAALEVVDAWGFEYRSHCVWVKERIGTGYWFRGLHELLLVGTCGDVPAPLPDQRLPSVFHEPAGRHSQKPEAFAEFIEAWFPHLAKLEMFARSPRPGWDIWGNEV